MKHVMLDLETLGTGDGAAIVQIGAVKFDPLMDVDGQDSGAMEFPEFYKSIRLSDPKIGIIEGNTLTWWLKQDERTRQQVLQNPDAVNLFSALLSFRIWLGDAEHVWANGSEFDHRLLRQAYERVGQTYPIGHRAHRCFRTLRATIPWAEEVRPLFVGKPHDALDDAAFQAGWAIRILRRIHGKTVPPSNR